MVTPALTLLLGVDLHYAMGASLVSVIATSSGAAAAYVREGYSNVRVGMFLEIATTLGAVAGAHLVSIAPVSALAIIFGVALLYSAWHSLVQHGESLAAQPDPQAVRLKLDGEYPTPGGKTQYHVQRVKAGFALMFGAGVLSGLLGIGSGAMKVVAMDQIMRIPFKVSTTTSNFMIGVTAAASAGIYLSRGYIDPRLAMPVMLGVLGGSLAGARLLTGAPTALIASSVWSGGGGARGRDDLSRRDGEDVMTDRANGGCDRESAARWSGSAAALVLAGGAWYVAASGHGVPDYRKFHPGLRGLAALPTLELAREAHRVRAPGSDCNASGARGVFAGSIRGGARPDVRLVHVGGAGGIGVQHWDGDLLGGLRCRPPAPSARRQARRPIALGPPGCCRRRGRLWERCGRWLPRGIWLRR